MSDTDGSLHYVADDLADRIWWRQDWGVLGLNTAARSVEGVGAPLQIRDQIYERGLGQHAHGEIVVTLDGQYSLFEAMVGVQWQATHAGSVVFLVFVDGEKRFESEIMKDRHQARPLEVEVFGAHELQLVARHGGDGTSCDYANWVDARLRLNSNPSGIFLPPVNMAQFAQVVSFDPHRMEGTLVSRVEPFPRADLRLSREVPFSKDLYGYVVDTSHQGVGCIGLEWTEPHYLRRLSLQYQSEQDLPPPEAVHLQCWLGESAWQGKWALLECQRSLTRRQWSWNLPCQAPATQKVRWLFPPTPKPWVIRSFMAHTWSAWKKAEVWMESVCPGTGHVEAYNGVFQPGGEEGLAYHVSWDRSLPLRIGVHYSQSARCKTDRTMIRMDLGDRAFAVAVEDVLQHEGVYVEPAGVLFRPGHSDMSLDSYRRQTDSQETLLGRVRKLPDQSFPRAMEKVHDPLQDQAPVMLSLACDNRKFLVHRDGRVSFDIYAEMDHPVPSGTKLYPWNYVLVPEFGVAGIASFFRTLEEEGLPAPVHVSMSDGAKYTQRTFVIPWGEEGLKALCVVQFLMENDRTEDVDICLSLSLETHAQEDTLSPWKTLGTSYVRSLSGRLVALVDARKLGSLHVGLVGGKILWRGKIQAGKRLRCGVCLPGWDMREEDGTDLLSHGDLLDSLRIYWKEVLQEAMEVEIPDVLLSSLIRTSQVHCLMTSRNEEKGSRIAPCIAAESYYSMGAYDGPFESEAQAVIRGMDLMGHEEYARRAFSFFQKRFLPEGYLTTGYTLIGTGEFLWVLAEHFQRSRDKDWMEGLLDTVAGACSWIVRERGKTLSLAKELGDKAIEAGLLPPGVSADWERFAYRFFQEAQYYAGLSQAARLLAEFQHPDAKDFAQEAESLKHSILRAYRWTQSRSPVSRLHDGRWVPAYPSQLWAFDQLDRLFPGEDGNRSWAYMVELGAHHLIPAGILDPNSEDADWIVDHMEDVQFLRSGMGWYPAEKNREDVICFGGFAKVQPYYCRITEVHGLRDDVKPFLRSYFNAIPSLLNQEVLSFWEHFHNIAAWHKPHETGWFLSQTRMMFVMERDRELWLAPFATQAWMKDGLGISVRNAPTRFGRVSYRIRSKADEGIMEASIRPPTRSLPDRIVLRLRHPMGKPMKEVWVNGKPHRDFDPSSETIRMDPFLGEIQVRAQFALAAPR